MPQNPKIISFFSFSFTWYFTHCFISTLIPQCISKLFWLTASPFRLFTPAMNCTPWTDSTLHQLRCVACFLPGLRCCLSCVDHPQDPTWSFSHINYPVWRANTPQTALDQGGQKSVDPYSSLSFLGLTILRSLPHRSLEVPWRNHTPVAN